MDTITMGSEGPTTRPEFFLCLPLGAKGRPGSPATSSWFCSGVGSVSKFLPGLL